MKRCFYDEPLAIPLDEIQIDDKLNFIEEPVEIIDREVKHLNQSRFPIVKVRWNSRRGPKFTWEREDQIKKNKRSAFWSLNKDILKINDSDNQYAVSIKEDMAYPCLHSPKTTKGMKINTPYPEELNTPY
ncbi:hypothetical protein Tco_0408619 [Tanacetum coccineum]